MKTILLIIILSPSLCFAQEGKSETPVPAKPSTTACPTWNKKNKKSDKSAYFQYLRSSKTKEDQKQSAKHTDQPVNQSGKESRMSGTPKPEKAEKNGKLKLMSRKTTKVHRHSNAKCRNGKLRMSRVHHNFSFCISNFSLSLPFLPHRIGLKD